MVSITATEHELRAKIQHPLDIDITANQQQRQQAARAAAIELGQPSEYWWEEVDNFGQLQDQGQRSELSATELAADG